MDETHPEPAGVADCTVPDQPLVVERRDDVAVSERAEHGGPLVAPAEAVEPDVRAHVGVDLILEAVQRTLGQSRPEVGADRRPPR